MKSTLTLMAGIVAGVSLTVAAAAFAQPFGNMGHGPGPGFGMGPGMGMGRGPMSAVDPTAVVESRLADLKAQLKITAAQESAWQAYTAEARKRATEMQAMRAQMQQDAGTAPERMAHRAAAMQQRGTSMTAMSNAFAALYAVLTPEQKAIADQPGGMMGHRGMRFGPRAG
jgi:Spy/CpxP family protein refolding chaperone